MAKRKKKKKTRNFDIAYILGRFVRLGLVVGIWCAIGIAGLVGFYALELPSLIDKPEMERKPLIAVEDIDGNVVARYGEFKGETIDISKMPNYLVYAVLSIEDRRFYQHFGIDPWGIARAMVSNITSNHGVQGGSTITQQLAKNMFLSRDRTLKRKIQEALLALWLEQKMTKDQILTAYLNRVYLGSGTYGVEAASRTYFHKSATDVTLHEAAIIAGLLKAPSRYSPLSNPKLADERANTVLGAMEDAGYITEKEAKKLMVVPDKKSTLPAENAVMASDSTRYYTDWVTGDLDKIIGTPTEDINISTTLVPSIQKAAENAVTKYLAEAKDKNVSQAAVIIMARDGAILAMVGGKNYAESQFNRAAQAFRQPGSSFKPVVYLTALEHGYTPNTLVNDAPITTGRYRPTNFKGEYMGEIPLYEALAYSLNTISYQLTKEVGVGYVIGTARRLGIEADLSRDLSLSLGSSGVPMIQMVTAYGTIANDGYQVEPYAIRKITDKDGTLIYSRPARGITDGQSMFQPETVRQLKGMMQGVVEFGTGGAAKFGPAIAGKTGTSQDFRDAWFSGFTDQYIGSVWVGNDDNSSMKKVTGGTIPAKIWRETMIAAYDSGKGRNLSAPSLSSTTTPVPADTDSSSSAEQSSVGSDDFGGMINRLLSATDAPSPSPEVTESNPPGISVSVPSGFALSPPPSVERPRVINSARYNARFND
ncbi:MAG: penicillin-binding, family protein [Micavibrio sp.]|nr:penicillin-binding, family protein [Micavibrio sp.]